MTIVIHCRLISDSLIIRDRQNTYLGSAGNTLAYLSAGAGLVECDAISDDLSADVGLLVERHDRLNCPLVHILVCRRPATGQAVGQRGLAIGGKVKTGNYPQELESLLSMT